MWKGEAAWTDKHQAPNTKHQRSTKFQAPKMLDLRSLRESAALSSEVR